VVAPPEGCVEVVGVGAGRVVRGVVVVAVVATVVVAVVAGEVVLTDSGGASVAPLSFASSDPHAATATARRIPSGSARRQARGGIRPILATPLPTALPGDAPATGGTTCTLEVRSRPRSEPMGGALL